MGMEEKPAKGNYYYQIAVLGHTGQLQRRRNPTPIPKRLLGVAIFKDTKILLRDVEQLEENENSETTRSHKES